MEFPVLETERLILREWSVDDAADLFVFYSREEVFRYVASEPLTTMEQSTFLAASFRSWFRENKPSIVWAVVLKESGRVIGEISLHSWSPENFRTQIGYSFSPEVWGKGIAKEAATAVITYGFKDFYPFTINRIEATTSPENTASRKLLERLGFTEEAVLRDFVFEKGKFVDSVMYSLLRTDVKER